MAAAAFRRAAVATMAAHRLRRGIGALLRRRSVGKSMKRWRFRSRAEDLQRIHVPISTRLVESGPIHRQQIN